MVRDTEDAEEFLRWLGQRRPGILAIDTETTGLDWWTPHFTRLVQFGDAETGWTLSVRDWRNDGQLNELAYVFANSAPSDPVLDGWRGLGMFRPHAWYWFCLPADVRTMIPPAELAAFLDDLETGRVRPKLAVADFNLAGLSPRLVAFIRAHYTYGAYDIWIRRPDL